MSNRRKNYYLSYTAFFIIISLIIFSYYFLNGRTFINERNDGLIQHYKALVYYSEYLRSVFTNGLTNFDFSIGEGSDILQTLHFYTIGDPLSVFSILFPRDKIYLYYDLSILIRLYLAGIVFSELCLYTGKKNYQAILIGSFVYIFSYWGLLNVNEHIYFLNPLIYLPLIILGIEMIIKEDKPYLFVVAVFLTALSNFYFFYMIVLLTVLYVGVRLLYLYHGDIKTLINKLIKMIIFSILGTLMAAVVVLPVMGAFLGDHRVSVDNSNGLLYSRFYYERIPSVFLGNDHEYDLCMGFASACLLAIALLFRKPKRNLLFIIYGGIILLMVCLPFAGKALNGFAYVINRWSFAIGLYVSYVLVHKWDEFKGNRNYLLVFLSVFSLLSMVSWWNRSMRVFVPLIIGFIFIIISNINIKNNGYDLRQFLMMGLIIMNIIYIADYDYSSRGDDRADDAATVERALDEITNSDAEIFKRNINDEGFYRYSGRYLNINAALLAKTHSTDFYWSVTNPNIINYREKLGLPDFTSYILRGYDNRTIPNALANVKYYLVKNDDEAPHGYEYLKNIEGIDVYENKYYLPFGYTYKNTLSYSAWDKLNQVQKEAALLDYIVVEEGNDDYQSSSYQKLDYQIGENDDIKVNEHQIDVSKENSQLHLKVAETEGEKHFYISGLNFVDVAGYIEENNTPVIIKVNYGESEKNIYYYTKEYQYYAGRKDFSVNIGDADEIVIVFPFPGIYAFDDMGFGNISFENYEKSINELKKDNLKDLEIGDDRIKGRIYVSEDKYLVLSVPYSKGWKAYVDGNKTEILRANETYMAIRLEKGEHNIELRYDTPLLKISALISLISCFGFGYYIFRNNKDLKK